MSYYKVPTKDFLLNYTIAYLITETFSDYRHLIAILKPVLPEYNLCIQKFDFSNGF
jgi:hypothetical protein